MEAMKVKARGSEEDNRKTRLRLILKAVAGLQLHVLANTGEVKWGKRVKSSEDKRRGAKFKNDGFLFYFCHLLK